MVSDKENVQAAKRYAGFHLKRSDTFNLYREDDDQEIQDEQDTRYSSYLAQHDHRYHEEQAKMNIMYHVQGHLSEGEFIRLLPHGNAGCGATGLS